MAGLHFGTPQHVGREPPGPPVTVPLDWPTPVRAWTFKGAFLTILEPPVGGF